MDAADLFKQGYERPSVVDYGTLVELTADVGMLLPFGVAGLSGPLVPETPGGSGGPDGPGPDATGSLQVPEAGLGGVGESSPEVQGGQGESAPAGAEAQGGGGGGGGGGGAGGAPVAAGGGGGSLPFTGLAAGALAAAGAGLTAAGAALRRAAQTRRFNRM